MIHTPFNPFHALNGAHVRARKVIELIASSNIETHVIYTPLDGMGSSLGALKDKSRDCLFKLHLVNTERKFSCLSGLSTESDIYPDDAIEEISDIIKNTAPNACIVNYVFLSKTLTLCPPTTEKYIDAHDKLSRASVFEDANLEPSFFCCSESHEAELCRRADVIIAITDIEREYFARIAPAKKVITLGHAPAPAFVDKPKPRRGGNQADTIQLGILASGHVFNVKSLNNFLRSFSPPAKVQLNIAGSACDQVDESFIANKRVTLLGRVDCAATFIRNQDLMLTPVDYGTGLKIKTVESVLLAAPTIGTEAAFDGIKILNSKGIFESSKSLGEWLTHQNHKDLQSYIKEIENLSFSRAIEYIRAQHANERRLISFISNGAKLPAPNTKVAPFKTVQRITHVINVTAPRPESDLYVAQQLAIKSIKRAKAVANKIDKNLDIRLIAKVIPGELKSVLDYIDLDGFSIKTDVNTSHEIDASSNPKSRCLPILSSLLRPEKMNGQERNSYYIYTNSDICLKDCFYVSVASTIERDARDAVVINRRTVDKSDCIHDLMLETGSYSVGNAHPGFDCFVLREDILSKFILGRTIVGIHLVGRVLLWNVVRFSKNPVIYYDKTLTYHYGDDNSSKNEASHWYTIHNCLAAVDVLDKLGDSITHKIAASNLSPNILKITYKPDIYIQANQKPAIVLHGMFRVGSTYIYHKINKALGGRAACFYEPFHESLSSFYRQTQGFSGADASMHPRITEASSLFEIYRNLTRTCSSSESIPYYSSDMSYYDMLGVVPEVNQKKYIYISNLYKHAKDRGSQPILQPNRTWLLSEQHLTYIFNRTDKVVKHFYIYRDSFDQFMSMLSLARKSGSAGFFRSLLIILYHAARAGSIPQSTNLSLTINRMKNLIGPNAASENLVKSVANKLLDPLDTEAALDIFLESLRLHLSRFPFHAISPIDMNRISLSLSYRRFVEAELMKNYIYVDLDDCSIATYSRNSDEWELFCRKGGDRLNKQLFSKLFDSAPIISTQLKRAEDCPSTKCVVVENISSRPLKAKATLSTTLLLLPKSRRTISRDYIRFLPDGIKVVDYHHESL